jgi:hypothetical protein
VAFAALFIKQRLGLTDEQTVEQVRDNAYLQFSLVFRAVPASLHSSQP